MTAPVSTQNSDPNQPGAGPAGGITFTEIEQQLKAAEQGLNQPKLDELKFEGEEIPESLRGKSAREVLNRTQELENALRQSEISRQQALTMAQLASQGRSEAPPAPKEPEPEPQITSEQVAAAFQEDPVKGIELMNRMTQQQVDRAGQHFMQRISPMLAGVSSSAEAEARRKYPDEFEIYKDDIAAVIKRLPNKDALSTPDSWDDMIAYVRGKDPMRLFNHMQTKEQTKRAAEAQAEQRNVAGVTMSSSQRAGGPVGAPVMDETTREVCRVLGMTEDDYVKWSKVS